MEATSIVATTAAVVGQTARIAQMVGEELNSLQDKLPQDTVRSLQGEVKSFGDACDVLQLLLNGLAGSQNVVVTAIDEQFYVKIQQALSEYATTVDGLDQHIRSARNSKSSFLRQRKIGIKSDDLVRARQRVDSHLLSVQLILGIVNLRNSLQASDAMELATLKSGIQELLRKQARLRATSQVNSPHLGQDQKLYANSATLIAEADQVLDLATSIYEGRLGTHSATKTPDQGSMASTSMVSLPTVKQPAMDTKSVYVRREIVAAEPATLKHADAETISSTPASAIELGQTGSGALETNSDNVNQWIHGLMSELDKRQRSPSGSDMMPSPLRSNRSYSQAPSEILSSQSTDERRTSDGTTLTTPSIGSFFPQVRGLPRSDAGRQQRAFLALNEDSDDDDIEVELARNVMASGRIAFDNGDYARARASFIEGLGLIQQLPVKLQATACDMLELRYQLAMCSLALDNDLAVEKALVEVLQQEPKQDAQRERLFHVSHILAQLYIRTARLALARQACNNALRGRRKLFGKESDGYYSSLALMARICELQNASLQAQGYLDMIPAAERHKHTFSHLRVEIDDGKEVVVVLENPAQLPYQAVAETARPPSNAPDWSLDAISPLSPAIDTSRISIGRDTSLPSLSSSTLIPEHRSRNSTTSIPPAPPYQRATSIVQSISRPAVRSGSSATNIQPSCTSDTTSIAASVSTSAVLPPTVFGAGYVDLLLSTRPSPENDYLGYCKGAWLLQTGNRKAMKKTKEFNYGRASNQVYWLSCSDSKCAFATEIEFSVIGTWTKLWRNKERVGITYRWAFLAKSHVRQPNKVLPQQTLYKCAFCVFQGLDAPPIMGNDAYMDHIAEQHRNSELGDVVLHQTCCINDRICTDRDEFDINLHPRN